MNIHLYSTALLAAALLTGACSADDSLRVPTLIFVTPAASQTVDASFDISVSFSGVVLGDTWSLSYVSDGTPAGGADIGKDLQVTSNRIRWDTSLMPPGRFYLYGQLSSLGGTFTATAPGRITVDHPLVVGNTTPVVAMSSPNGGEVLTKGATATLTWAASDANSETMTYKLEVSSDDGQSWSDLVSDLTEMTYDWAIPDTVPSSVAYRVRVSAIDTNLATGVDVSDRTFTVR